MKASSLLTVLANLPLGGKRICDLPAQLESLKQEVCKGVDISSVDPPPPGPVKCDALSVATAIEGAPVEKLGSIYDATRPPLPCGASFKASCD